MIGTGTIIQWRISGWDSLGLGVKNTSIYLCFRFNSLGRDICMQSTYLSAVQVSAIKIQRYCLFLSVIQLKLLVPSCCSFSGWFITIVPYSDYLYLHFWQDLLNILYLSRFGYYFKEFLVLEMSSSKLIYVEQASHTVAVLKSILEIPLVNKSTRYEIIEFISN